MGTNCGRGRIPIRLSLRGGDGEDDAKESKGGGAKAGISIDDLARALRVSLNEDSKMECMSWTAGSGQGRTRRGPVRELSAQSIDSPAGVPAQGMKNKGMGDEREDRVAGPKVAISPEEVATALDSCQVQNNFPLNIQSLQRSQPPWRWFPYAIICNTRAHPHAASA